jgi:hypothetical protein
MRKSRTQRQGGRRSAIHDLRRAALIPLEKGIVEIFPIWILSADQSDLPGPWPILNVILALNGGHDILVPLGVNEFRQPVSPGEGRAGPTPMFVSATCNIVGDTDVQRANRPIGHEVHPSTTHASIDGGWPLKNRGWRTFARHDDRYG